MAFVRKVWKNRISEFFNRYRLENVRTGEAFNAYINLNDGAVEEQGDRLNAEALNDLEGRIAEGFNSIESYDYSVMIAGTESTNISSQAYAVGQFLVYNKLLYKVISAIAVGDTLAVGTNITQKKIANEVSDHLVVNGTEFYFDYQGGKFGYNTSSSRGADTFHPFKDGYSKSQTKSFTLACAQDSSGSASTTFDQLTKVDGLLSISVSGSNVLSRLSLSGKTLSASGYQSGWGTAYVTITATAFEF